MVKTAKIDVKGQDVISALQAFFRSLLELEDIHGILVPQHLPMKKLVMPMLVTDPDRLEAADPLAPAFPMNAAKLVSRLTRKPMGAKVVAVLRSCEIRAFYELVKLKQGRRDDVVLVGIDCLGAYDNMAYARIVEKNPSSAAVDFTQNALAGETSVIEDIDLAPACKACEHPVPTGARPIATRCLPALGRQPIRSKN
jgi:formate dehydrogenase subunit beta